MWQPQTANMQSSYSLPEGLPAEELVRVSIDSTQLSSVVSALMKTIQSQSQCIETLDREARARKAEADIRFKELETRQEGDFSQIKHAFDSMNSGIQADIRGIEGRMLQMGDSCHLSSQGLASDIAKNADTLRIIGEQMAQRDADMRSYRLLADEERSRRCAEEADIRQEMQANRKEALSACATSETRIRTELHSHITEVSSQAAQLKNQLQTSVTDICTDIVGVKTLLKQINDDLQRQKDVTRDSMQAFNEDLSRLAIDLQNVHKTCEANDSLLQQEHQALDSRFSREIQHSQAEIATLQTYLTETRSDLQQLHAQTISDIQSNKDTLRLLIEESRQHGADLIADRKHWEEVDARTKGDLRALLTDAASHRAASNGLETELVALRDDVIANAAMSRAAADSFTKQMESLKNFASLLDAELGRVRDVSDRGLNAVNQNLDSQNQTIESIRLTNAEFHRNLQNLAKELEIERSQLDELTRDGHELLLFFGLSKANVQQANKAGNQVDVLRTTPHIRALTTDIQAWNAGFDRRLHELLEQIQAFSAMLSSKADREMLQHTQDVLMQNISSGLKDAQAHVEDLRLKVVDRCREMEDTRSLREKEFGGALSKMQMQLDTNRAEQDKAALERSQTRSEVEVGRLQRQEITNQLSRKADADKVSSLSRHFENLQDKLAALEQALDAAILRVNTGERDAATCDRLVATARQDLQRLDAAITEIRNSLSGPFVATVERRGFQSPAAPQLQDSEVFNMERTHVREERDNAIGGSGGLRQLTSTTTTTVRTSASPPRASTDSPARLRSFQGAYSTPTLAKPLGSSTSVFTTSSTGGLFLPREIGVSSATATIPSLPPPPPIRTSSLSMTEDVPLSFSRTAANNNADRFLPPSFSDHSLGLPRRVDDGAFARDQGPVRRDFVPTTTTRRFASSSTDHAAIANSSLYLPSPAATGNYSLTQISSPRL